MFIKAALLTLSLIFCTSVYADGYPELHTGMTPKDVLGTWGHPIDKIDAETSRLEHWIYKHGQVTFKELSVESWHDERRSLLEQLSLRDEVATTTNTQTVDAEITNILQEISAGSSEESGAPLEPTMHNAPSHPILPPAIAQKIPAFANNMPSSGAPNPFQQLLDMHKGQQTIQ